jgi:dihydrofolate reductase
MIRQIAAIDSQRGIATDSGIPWNLPGDTAYFREKTANGLIVMGRATYDEFASPLHGGENYVLSTTATPLRAGFQAIADLQELRAAHPDEDIWVIGGATVYRETIAEAEELLLTQVQKDFHCTKFFPPYEADFELDSQSAEHREAGLTYRFQTWRSRKPDREGSTGPSSADVPKHASQDVA